MGAPRERISTEGNGEGTAARKRASASTAPGVVTSKCEAIACEKLADLVRRAAEEPIPEETEPEEASPAGDTPGEDGAGEPEEEHLHDFLNSTAPLHQMTSASGGGDAGS